MNHTYYYNLISKSLKFLIPEGKTLLYYGHYNSSIIPSLKPSYSICVSEEKNFDFLYNKDYPNISFVHTQFQDYIPKKKFDYIVLDVAIGKTEDICHLLKNISQACYSHTRIIVHQENHLWQSLLKFAALLGLKKKEKTKNWLSVGDVYSYLKTAGFEPIRSFNKNLFPVKMGFIGPLINSISSFLPIFDFAKLDQFVIARILSLPEEDPSTTICITVRDEEANIEPLVRSLPRICNNQEILFVEGHSTDNTVQEIKRLQLMFPEKNIRLIHQPGIGQGDAIRIGFHQAKGDIIVLYEGDGTSDPSDIQYFYECIKNGRFEFIEGSRFSYPIVSESMPILNKIGNIIFAKWFSLFLKQRTTDVLSGVKAITRKNFVAIYNTWGFLDVYDPFGDFELLYGSLRYGLKIGEIPIRYKPRLHGASKTRFFKHGSYLIKMAWKGYFVFRNSKF